ncbi:hypothetical protein EI94DRAFT_1097680 [Lactarius quietus]|nr:hypothetical protein EI94DRAFT_1097680 [Lactarius quietus]
MSSHSRPSISSRPPDGNTSDAIGQGPSTSQFPRRAHARPINIPERRLWSHSPPNSTTSEGRVHTVSPYGSFFVGDMDLDNPPDSNSPSQGGGWTRGTSADTNRFLYQTSARRPPSSQNYLRHRPPPLAPGLFDTTDPTYFGMPGAPPVPGRNAPNEGEGTPSTVTTSTHRSQSNHLTSWNRDYRNSSNNPHNHAHNARARQPRVVTGTTLPPGSPLSNPDRQKTRGVTRTTWRK